MIVNSLQHDLAAVANARTRRELIAGAAIVLSAFAVGPAEAGAGIEEEISRTGESIHQEPVFKANRKRVYEALTDAQQFTKVTQIIAAMDSRISLDKIPTQISRDAGGTFTLFGGIIMGRQIELVPAQRIVQAWRVAHWDAGFYSIARFELREEGAGTKIVFDHTGFPNGQAEHLAQGWKVHYWEPLNKFLA